MNRPLGLDLRPSARTGLGTPGLGGLALAAVGGTALLVGVRRRSPAGAAVALVGGALASRGLTGAGLGERLVDVGSATRPRFRLSTPINPEGDVISSAITVNREREPVWLFWRNPSNIALLHGWIAGVAIADDGRQTWRVEPPGAPATDIDTRVVDEIELERMAWASTGDEPMRIQLDLRDAPRGGTEIVLAARLPGGGPLEAVRRLTGGAARTQLDEMLRRARALLETGEIPTAEAQPSGRAGEVHPPEPARLPVGAGA